MSMLQHGLSEDSSYTINQSLRLRASNSAYLSRTPAVAGNQTTWTFSCMVKLGLIPTSYTTLFAAGAAANQTMAALALTTTGQIGLYANSSGLAPSIVSSNVLRDPSAWYHLQVVYDSTNATANERMRLYVNGSRITSLFANYPPTQGAAWAINVVQQHRIGTGVAYPSSYFDGYLSEINFIDGQALDPSYFGFTCPETGIWVPKKYTGTYGNNGFYLPFNDATSLTTLGYDRSGNGNNWTCNGISITAGATYDVMKDSPTNGLNEVGNYAVLNPLDKGSSVSTLDGNLKWAVGGTSNGIRASEYLPSSGKFYWEATVIANGGNEFARIGVCGADISLNVSSDTAINQWLYAQNNGYKVNAGTAVAYGTAYTNGDIISVAVDVDNGKIWWAKNGVWQASGDPASGVNPAYSNISVTKVSPYFTQAGLGITIAANFGQRPFAYTPPTGFKALHTGNLTQPTIKKPQQHFDVKLDTGANIKATCEGLFTYFMEWIKDRANANNHQLIDTVRGTSAVLQSNTTAAETTYVAPSGSSVGWVWNAGGAAVTNTDGSITSQVSANVAAGFSVVTYTGTGANATVGHGLGVAPKFVIVRARNAAAAWPVYHVGMTSAAYVAYLNTTNAQASDSTFWQSTNPTSLVFSIGTSTQANQNTLTYVAYCFAEIAGYSKFGSYTGNGSTDGPFVFCGFRPRYVMIKCISATGSWVIIDTVRDLYNLSHYELYPDSSTSEGGAYANIDILANGFKLRVSNAYSNASGYSYIFAAFAESPFTLNNRAR